MTCRIEIWHSKKVYFKFFTLIALPLSFLSFLTILVFVTIFMLMIQKVDIFIFPFVFALFALSTIESRITDVFCGWYLIDCL